MRLARLLVVLGFCAAAAELPVLAQTDSTIFRNPPQGSGLSIGGQGRADGTVTGDRHDRRPGGNSVTMPSAPDPTPPPGGSLGSSPPYTPPTSTPSDPRIQIGAISVFHVEPISGVTLSGPFRPLCDGASLESNPRHVGMSPPDPRWGTPGSPYLTWRHAPPDLTPYASVSAVANPALNSYITYQLPGPVTFTRMDVTYMVLTGALNGLSSNPSDIFHTFERPYHVTASGVVTNVATLGPASAVQTWGFGGGFSKQLRTQTLTFPRAAYSSIDIRPAPFYYAAGLGFYEGASVAMPVEVKFFDGATEIRPSGCP